MGLTISCSSRSVLSFARDRCTALAGATAYLSVLCAGLTGLGQLSVAQPPSIRAERPVATHKVRARRFLAGRTMNGLSRTATAFASARRQHAVLLAQPRSVALSTPWQPVGPAQIATAAYGNVTGRVTAIAIDPADTMGNTVYIGTTGGGVWKSTNAAGPAQSVTFTPLTDTLPVFSADSGNAAIASLSIGALSIANGTVLAGTGDPNDALDSYYGSGLLRSTDGGVTWALIQSSHDGAYGDHLFTGLSFAGFAWSTVTPATVVAAVSDAAEADLVNADDTTYGSRGLYFSNDSGVTWQMATIRDGSQTVQSPQLAGSNSGGNAVTAVAWNSFRQRFYAAVRYHGYYESADGATWTRLTAQPGAGLTATACPPSPGTTGSAACPIFRGALAVQSATGDTFAFTIDANNRDQGIWQDVCASNGSACANAAVSFASKLNTASLEQGQGSTVVPQGDYNLSLAAVASGTDTLLFAGTVDLFRCSPAAGCEFRNTTNTLNGCSAPAMVAPAQHAIAAIGSVFGSTLLFLGNDGGLWRSVDGINQQGSPCSADDASHFQNLNRGLGSLAEVVSFAQHPSDADTLLVGVGANGTAATSTASKQTPWPQLAFGEGGFTAIDSVNPANWYISSAAGVSIKYCGKGAVCAASDFNGLPTIGPTQLSGDASLIDAPWLLDPASLSNAIIGTCRVWRGPSTDGSTWSSSNTIATAFDGSQSATCSSTNSFVRSLAAGGPASSLSAAPNTGSTVLYAGLAGTLDGGGNLGGHLFSTNSADTANANTAWTDLAFSPVTNDASDRGVFNPGGFDISSVAVDPHDTTGQTVYATVMGFTNNGTNAPHLYRSVDGGAHWTNISANLPNAPANSVAVDPNDANTVYVALDTGVYVTTQVGNCTVANCWGVFGSGLPNAPVIQLAASSSLSTGSGTVGGLRAATYGRGIWQIPLITVATATSAVITLTPAALTFGIQAVGSSSAQQNITITNTGSAALTVARLTTTGDFHENDNCISTPIAINQSCSAQVTFLATATGSRTGVLTVYANVSGGQVTAALSGTGAAPAAVVLNPLNLNFGVVIAGSTSSSQDLVVKNTGGVSATLQDPSITGDFTMTGNTCGTVLPTNVSCTATVAFAPTSSGTRTGTFSIQSSAGTQTTSLTGIGAAAATDTLSPLTLTFPATQYGTTSAPQRITLTNSGDATLTLISAQVTGGDFSVSSNCGSSLIGHAACSLSVAFAPMSNGPLTGILTVADSIRTQIVTLSGTGIAPPLALLAPSSVSFPDTQVGTISAAQTITITNSGGGTLVVSNVSITGAFIDTENCTRVSLANKASCTIQVKFSPTVSGSASGTLTVVSNTPGGQSTASLIGSGATPAAIVLTPASLDFGKLLIGSTSGAQNIAISNTGGLSATLQVPTVSASFRITANTCGTTLGAGSGCTVAIAFVPAASGTSNGSFSIPTSAGTRAASLTGIGQSPPTDALAPLSLAFASQQYGTISASQAVTLTNSGDAPLTLIAAQVSAADFFIVGSCGPMLAGHTSCTFAIAFSPLSAGQITGTLTVSDQLRTQTVALSGIGVAPPLASLAPSTVTFPDTPVGKPSSAQTVTLTNIGGGQLVVTKVSVSEDFTDTEACSIVALANKASCAIHVVFTPTVAGPRTGTLTVFGNMPNGQTSTALTGNGAAPASIVLTPTSLAFGTITLGMSSPAQNIAISNTGGVSATLQTPSITGDFKISANTCSTTLPPSTGCTVAVIYTATGSGLSTGTFTVTNSTGTQTATLTGTGATVATDGLSPLTLAFAPQQINTASPAQPVTLTNTGDNALTLIAAQITSGNFTAVNNCGPTLPGHSNCTIAVASVPKNIGPDTGVLTISDQFRNQTVALSGSGLPPPGVSVSPTGGLTFAPTGVTQTSAPQTVTISNQREAALSINGITIGGDFTLPASGNTCTSTIAPDSSCTFLVSFSPTADGLRNGMVTVSDNASGSPQTIALSGTGVDFSLNADGQVSITVASGTSAVYPLLLASDPGIPGNANFTCTGAPTNATCVVVPSTVPLGATTVIIATVATGVVTSADLHAAPSRSRVVRWAFLLPLALLGSTFFNRRRSCSRWPNLLAVLFVLSGLIFADACGSGRVIPPPDSGSAPTPPSSSTPSGTYPITVSATSAGLTRSVSLTLIVK